MRRLFNEFVYLLYGIAAAGAWFALLLAGWLAVAVTAVTPLVVPVLIGFRWATRGLALGEATVARALLGAEVAVPRTKPMERGYVGRIRSVFADTDFWRQQAYGVVRLFGGFAAGVAAASAVGSSLYLVSLPIDYRWVDMWEVHTLGRAFAAVPVGLVALGVSALLVRGLARTFGRVTPALVGCGPRADVPAPPAQGRRTGLSEHAAAYVLVNALCIVIWAATTRAYFWPMWPLLALAMPPAVHALAIRSRSIARRWRATVIHAGSLGVVAAFLVATWAVTNAHGYFWPVWPIVAFILTAGARALAVRRWRLEERIGVLETTRAGAVEAAEGELRRIERDLHDGAQARLVALGMSLGLAEQRLAEDPDGARRLLEEARAGAEEALRELRDLARGIHPPVLADRGLEAALAALVARLPLRVTLDVDVRVRPPVAQESAAYFVAAEALANASKHADATHVTIAIHRTGDDLVVRIDDDGRGGADGNGRGLSGLAQRVAALDGRLRVDSPAGGPTRVEAVMPCAP